MSDNSPLVAGRLAEHRLVGPAFDLTAITADHDVRLEMDRSLDALIGTGDAAEVVAFDPKDPR
jgi:hypothetical protein